MSALQFGISTHLYHDQRLGRDHLVEIAGARVRARSRSSPRGPHFDYHRRARRSAELAEWLRRHGPARCTRCTRRSPRRSSAGTWGDGLLDRQRRRPARERAPSRSRERPSALARRLRCVVLVRAPRGPRLAAAPAATTTARTPRGRSLEALAGVRRHRSACTLALEVIPNELSTAGALVRLIEDELELPAARHLPRLRPRAPDGRRARRRSRRVSGHLVDDARARQPRARRRSPACRSRDDRLGRRR